MKEKIYYFNEGSKTLHIKGLCKNSGGYGCKSYSTEQQAIQDNGKHIHMCIECEEKKEEILQNAVKNLSKWFKGELKWKISNGFYVFAKYGNYAAVGRKIGRSGSTVAKHINLKDTPAIVAHTFKEVVRV